MMGFKDKAREVIQNVKETIKDPDGALVEKTWPADEPPVAENEPESTQGADPDLDASTDDQYKDER